MSLGVKIIWKPGRPPSYPAGGLPLEIRGLLDVPRFLPGPFLPVPTPVG
jgi:hypothetical protein